MNETDTSIKKKWLISIIAIMIFNQIPLFIETIKTGKTLNVPSSFNYIILLILTIITVSYLWISYRCAYKKPGTKLLTFYIIAGPIGILTTIILLVLGKSPQMTQSWGSIFITLLQQAGGLWLLFLNWKLRIFNKKLQKNSV